MIEYVVTASGFNIVEYTHEMQEVVYPFCDEHEILITRYNTLTMNEEQVVMLRLILSPNTVIRRKDELE